MDPKVKEQWTAALRSGEYQQGTGALRLEDAEGTERFCCLGVLCDLAVKAGVEVRVRVAANGARWYGVEASAAYLPPEVQRWAGLAERNPKAPPRPGANREGLANLNDDSWTFAQIAEVIERNF